MIKIRFHITFWIYSLALALQGKLLFLVYTIFSAFLHECGHSLVAYIKGYYLNEIVLLPYGAVLSGDEALYGKDALPIALGGPIVNIVIALFTVALWWIAPSTYSYTLDLFRINIGIFCFNLLPIFPLDGSRALLAVSSKPLKALTIFRYLGVFVSVIMLGLFIISAFFGINYSLGIMSIIVFISATQGTKNESYKHIAECIKDYTMPLIKEKIVVNENIRLIKLLRLLKPNKILSFEIWDTKNNKQSFFDEAKLLELCKKNNLTTRIKDCK